MFRLSAHDNGLYFFRDRSDVTRCLKCGSLSKKWEEDLSSVSVPVPPKNDASYSYDGVLVTSALFKRKIEELGISGLAFRPIDRGVFAVRPTSVVKFDAEKRGTRFVDRCDLCGEYKSVVGATPVHLLSGSMVAETGFVRTDLEFGSADEKTPVVLCGHEAGRILGGCRLRGVDLLEVKKVSPDSA